MVYRTAVDGEEMPEVYEGDRPYIFVCYESADSGAAMSIIRALADGGYRVWYDGGIEPGTKTNDCRADHIHGCACVVVLISRSWVSSERCKSEVEDALGLGKDILPIYLEKVELRRGLRTHLGGVKPLKWHEYDSDDDFNKVLFAVKMLDSCLTEEGRVSRGVKPRVVEAPEAGMVTDPEGGADGDNPVKPSRQADEQDDDEQEGNSRWHFLTIAAAIVVGLLVVYLVGTAIPYVLRSNDTDVLIAGVPVRDELDDYKWGELKQLATAIAQEQDGEWIDIARVYNLVDNDGKLRGDEKVFSLDDGTETSIRILGFHHDELSNGGRAGITFEFADVPTTHSMNEKWTNEGGWEKSKMREWLDSGFFGSLPSGLQSCIETVRKKTNNVGRVESEDGASVVTSTDDRLWLLSAAEVYGHTGGVWSLATYDAEGRQYKLYADQGVTAGTYDFCKKDGACSWWWLRSPGAGDAYGFHGVYDDGDWGSAVAYNGWDVSPGFCF